MSGGFAESTSGALLDWQHVRIVSRSQANIEYLIGFDAAEPWPISPASLEQIIERFVETAGL